MSRPARSLFAFGIYVLLVGAAFLAIPAPLMAALRLPPASPGWGRLIGLLALVIGTYDVVAAWAESLLYIRASVFVRFGFAAGVTLVVLLGEMPPSLLPLGAIDLAGAIWTMFALKATRSATAALST